MIDSGTRVGVSTIVAVAQDAVWRMSEHVAAPFKAPPTLSTLRHYSRTTPFIPGPSAGTLCAVVRHARLDKSNVKADKSGVADSELARSECALLPLHGGLPLVPKLTVSV
jgi:hypothetical protein